MRGHKASFLTISVVLGGMSLSGPAHAKDLARVNQKVLTDRDLNLALSSLNETQRQTLLQDTNRRYQLIQNLIDREVIAQAAEKADLGAKIQDDVNSYRKDRLMAAYVDQEIGSQLTPSHAKRYYEAHKDEFSTDLVHVQHILLRDEVTAKKVHALVKAPNSDFLKIAETYSADPNVKINRGDLGFISRTTVIAEVAEAAFSANQDEVVGPVMTPYGYEVIKALDRRSGRTPTYDEIELQVMASLRQRLIRNLADKLKNNYKIEMMK